MTVLVFLKFHDQFGLLKVRIQYFEYQMSPVCYLKFKIGVSCFISTLDLRYNLCCRVG